MHMEDLSSSSVFFNCFFQCLEVVTSEFLHILSQIYSELNFFHSEAIMNGIVFQMFFSTSSLLIYRKGTDFCWLILYLAPFLEILISSKNFLVESLKYRMILSTSNNLTGFLFVSLFFLYLYCSSWDFRHCIEYGWGERTPLLFY